MRERRAQKIEEPGQRGENEDAFKRAGDGLAELEEAADRPACRRAAPTSSVPTRMATLINVVALVQLIGAASAKALSPYMSTKRSRIYQGAMRRKRYGLAAVSPRIRRAS